MKVSIEFKEPGKRGIYISVKALMITVVSISGLLIGIYLVLLAKGGR